MKCLAVLILSISFFISAKALANPEAVTVFDVRKPIAMSNSEKVHKDFYLNGGTEKGLKAGVVVTVTRRKALYDTYQNRSPGDLIIPVGKLRIIHSQKGLSVGRMHSVFARGELPILDYNYIMVGDRLDLGTITKGKRRRSASLGSSPSKARRPVVLKPQPVIYGPALPPVTEKDLASTAPKEEKKSEVKARVSKAPAPSVQNSQLY